MPLYSTNPQRPTVRPADSVPVEPTPTQLSPSPENTITCIEDAGQFAHVQAAVLDQFHPANDFQRLIADDLAESIWVKNRLGAISNQSLNFAIQSDWDNVSQRHPNVDPALRTHLAWGQVAVDPAHVRATDVHTRAYRRIQTDVRLLAFVARLK